MTPHPAPQYRPEEMITASCTALLFVSSQPATLVPFYKIGLIYKYNRALYCILHNFIALLLEF
jgi:hypothetical protein